ncbi:MAG: MBL fold metallo-hydrolase [Candidatus Bathyarchaeia archaeon]
MASIVKVFEDPSIVIHLIEPYGFSSNVYVIQGKTVALIDVGVGGMENRLAPKLREIGIGMTDVRMVILTHDHIDHVGGLEEIATCCSPVIMAHESTIGSLSRVYDLDFRMVGDGEKVPIDGHFKVLHTPGHSDGSICLYDTDRGILFSGDTVFPEGWFGRTDLPTGSSRLLVDSLDRLQSLNVEKIFPGHGEVVLSQGLHCIKTAFSRARGMTKV